MKQKYRNKKSNPIKICIECGIVLTKNNLSKNNLKRQIYICKSCHAKEVDKDITELRRLRVLYNKLKELIKTYDAIETMEKY